MLDHTQGGAPAEPAPRVRTALRDALRRARLEAAERTDVVTDLREAEIARLNILKEALDPIIAQAPPEVDLFDVGVVPGERPRLFVDMVSFVEMGRDRRVYRFMRDGRHGRSCVVESETVEPIVEAVTTYVARRLVERERLLADDDRLASAADFGRPLQDAARAAGAPALRNAASDPPAPERSADPEPPAPSAVRSTFPQAAAVPPSKRGWLGALVRLALSFAFGAALGVAVLAAVLYAVAKGVVPI